LPREFTLPCLETIPPARQLLAALYDCIRHGHSHQYQQIPVALGDGVIFMMSLTGVDVGRSLRVVRDERSRRMSEGTCP
jgi:hypothetical protein